MMNSKARFQQRIERILKPFRRDDNPELINFVSGVNEPAAGAIDDGSDQYGEPLKTQRPDWVQKDLAGWK
jgi:hypothetical protein